MGHGTEIEGAIRDMVEIVNAPDATAEERDAALETIADALFPASQNGDFGVCLEGLREKRPAR